MSADYYKTIEQLKPYLSIPRVESSVKKAIEILEKEAIEATAYEMNAVEILQELRTKNQERPLTDIEKIRIIVHRFLQGEEFLDIDHNSYSLIGFDATYVFKLIFVDSDNTVVLNRLPKFNRTAKSASHCFQGLPMLTEQSDQADRELLKRILRSLRTDLRRTWQYIHIDRTPSISELSNLSEIDFE